MNKSETVTWGAFKEKLVQNPGLDLQFQYANDKWVAPSYHITEIKQAPITSVDCGGVKNEWTEIIVQLMEPANQQQLRAMKARKALSIIDIVEKVMPLDSNGEVRIEFGNNGFDTRQLSPAGFILDDENLIVNLSPVAVQCKANDRGGSCGEPVKQKVQLKDLTADSSCCAPGGRCC